ncbi:hypothetical protein AVEN_38797-1, partial [Araneus ventricosus]
FPTRKEPLAILTFLSLPLGTKDNVKDFKKLILRPRAPRDIFEKSRSSCIPLDVEANSNMSSANATAFNRWPPKGTPNVSGRLRKNPSRAILNSKGESGSP